MSEDIEIIEEDEGWELLHRIYINDRCIITWCNPDNSTVKLAIFHSVNRPNRISQNTPKTPWGHLTYYLTDIDKKEIGSVVGLYTDDIINKNYWWEEDED